MTPLTRARLPLSSLSLPLLALLVAACGSSGEEGGGDVPDFSGANAPPAAGMQEPAPGADPNAPAAAPSDVPGAVNEPSGSNGEAPSDGIALDPTEPAPGSGDSSGAAEPQPTAPGEPAPAEPAPGEPAPAEPAPPEQPEVPPSPDRPTRGTPNLFTELLGIPVGEVDARVRLVIDRIFGIGTNESPIPQVDTGFRLYYELPQDPSQAFIWCADENDVRSEGQSYGMMIAVQMNMQTQFDRLWNFAKQRMQFSTNDAWNRYFRWQGQVNANQNQINVNFGENGPAPDGDEYFAAALYLADRRWGSNGAINYEQEADAIASAMLNNTAGGGQGRVPIINAQSNMVVFFPQGTAAGFSDPSYHLPAFYELFAQDGNPGDAARWRQIANVSRQYFVQSANANTGLHPDYANFNGTPNTGGNGQTHDQFRFDAWRVPLNMAIDFAWTGPDARLQTQVEKYHAFFGPRLGANIPNALFLLNGTVASDDTGPSTALAATLAAGALASSAPNRAEFVENLWNTQQQSGTYRYYQEAVYALGLLATAGWFGYEWAPQQ